MSERLEDLQRRAGRLGREGFCSRHPHPFLIRLDERGGKDEPVAWAFPTPPKGPLGTEARVLIPPAGPMAHVHELIKNSGKGARDHITVGRTDENDVVISEMSISRHHATLKPVATADWQIHDEGSRNGTRINGVRIQPRTFTKVQSGDVINFGDVALLLLFPDDLVDQLARLLGE